MFSLLRVVMAGFVLVIGFEIGFAQNRFELEHKYGGPEEASYKVREGIVLKASFHNDQISTMVITTEDSSNVIFEEIAEI